ncbi:MAG TPA: hypothetical protein VFK44_08895 [Bacillales bacterium]|nr:hypothetical protein [Bacillales bacterium]
MIGDIKVFVSLSIIFIDVSINYQNALIYAKNNDYLKMFLYHNISYSYSKKSEPKMALYYLLKASEILGNSNDFLQAQNLYLLAANYFKTGNVHRARKTLSVGLDFCETY